MKRSHKEDDIQTAVAAHLRLRGVPGLVWWHTPNGGRRNPREMARFKKMGVLNGVADLILFHKATLFALELKAENGRPSEAQLGFLQAIRDQGGHACDCYGLEPALRVLESWGLLRGKAR